jgi:hypothetical protein
MEGQRGDHAGDEALIAYYSSTANATLCDAAQLSEAQMHGRASGVYPLESTDVMRIREEDRCPCCFFPHNHLQRFSLRNVDALRGLGLGFPFLFYLSGYLIVMMCVIFAVAALPCLMGNGRVLACYTEPNSAGTGLRLLHPRDPASPLSHEATKSGHCHSFGFHGDNKELGTGF